MSVAILRSFHHRQHSRGTKILEWHYNIHYQATTNKHHLSYLAMHISVLVKLKIKYTKGTIQLYWHYRTNKSVIFIYKTCKFSDGNYNVWFVKHRTRGSFESKRCYKISIYKIFHFSELKSTLYYSVQPSWIKNSINREGRPHWPWIELLLNLWTLYKIVISAEAE